MATEEQMEVVTQRIEWLKSMSYVLEEGNIPEPASDTMLPWWEDLSIDEQQSVLIVDVDWDGFAVDEKYEVIRRVLDGQEPEMWMDGDLHPDLSSFYDALEQQHEDFILNATSSEPLEPSDDVTPEQLKELAIEIRADEHAARERDYGADDAATYEQRVRAGAATVEHLEPVQPFTPQELDEAVAKIEDWQIEVARERLSSAAAPSEFDRQLREAAERHAIKTIDREIDR